MAAALTLAGCLAAAPSADSAGCLADDDCTACGRCDNGRCVFDELASERPFCVDETEDPCDGVDTDGNGIVDDPETCWAPVFAWTDGEGARCFGGSATDPPERCPGFTLEDDAPAFALTARLLPDTVAVHGCSAGDNYVLVPDVPLFGDTDVDAKTTLDAWRAAGYTCGPALGNAFTAPPDFGAASTPFGGICAVSLFTGDAGGAARWTARLGNPTGSSGICEPGSTLWVASDADDCEGSPPAGCAPAACPGRASGVMKEASPPSGSALEPGLHRVVIPLENDGDVAWHAGWCIDETSANVHMNGSAFLADDASPGERVAFTVNIDAPAQGIDLRGTWLLRDALCGSDGDPVMEIAYDFDVATPYAASVVTASPADASVISVSSVPLDFTIVLANSGDAPWPDDLQVEREVSDGVFGEGVALLPAEPGGTVVVSFSTSSLTEPNRYTHRWRVVDSDGTTIPVDGAATFSLTVWAQRPNATGALEAKTIAPGTVLPTGLRFYQVLALKNTGGGAWLEGTTLRHVAGALAQTQAITRVDVVPPGSTWIVALPMQIPAGASGTLRDGWTLYDASDRVIGLERRDADGGPAFGTTEGAWHWTEVVAGTPCVTEDGK